MYLFFFFSFSFSLNIFKKKIKKNIIIENIDVGQTIDAPHHQSINDIVIYKTKNNKENIIIGGSGIYYFFILYLISI